MRGLWLAAFLVTASIGMVELATSAVADPGDKEGWSVLTDPRRRAFLIYVPAADGPRLLTLGCLRDVDNFTVIAAGLPGMPASASATLVLENGEASYVVHGEVGADRIDGKPAFEADINADATALRTIAGSLLPVLERGTSMLLTVGSAKQKIPLAGVVGPLRRFKSICFAKR